MIDFRQHMQDRTRRNGRPVAFLRYKAEGLLTRSRFRGFAAGDYVVTDYAGRKLLPTVVTVLAARKWARDHGYKLLEPDEIGLALLNQN